ncbi:MAG: DNA-3-methyladenine glycosylase family protein [Thermoleophilaceae bacterium]
MALPFSPEAMEHLMAGDLVMQRIIEDHGPLHPEERRRGRPEDSYGALVRSITGQQLSVKAARTIYGRLCGLYGDRTPRPAELIATHPGDLRAVGLSYSKAGYLRDLAERVEGGELDLEHLPSLGDREVSEMLTAVKGLGQWTADMFMMFHLGRPDVLPVGDLGIRKAAEIQYGLRKLPSPDRLKRLGRPWRPYRTLACVYLWESLDNAPA